MIGLSDGGQSIQPQPLPPCLAVDANGFVWRVYPEGWSMAPNNPDNEPIPGPITYYVPEDPDSKVRWEPDDGERLPRERRVVYIAECPEHGLHGEREDCFVCGGPVEQVPMERRT